MSYYYLILYRYYSSSNCGQLFIVNFNYFGYLEFNELQTRTCFCSRIEVIS